MHTVETPVPAAIGDGEQSSETRNTVSNNAGTVNPSEYLKNVRERLTFTALANALGLNWTVGRGHPCPAGHGSTSGTCCRVYDDGAYCFNCKRHFDHQRLVEAVQGLSRDEALAALSELSGVPLPDGLIGDTGNEAIEDELADVIAARTEFARIAHENLNAGDREYLTGRGIQPETMTGFLIGSAVPGIVDQMAADGWPQDVLVKAGLAVRDGDGLRQFIIGRVTLPTLLPDGRVVEITGRLNQDGSDAPKYLKLLVHSDKHPQVSEHIPVGVLFGVQTISKSSDRLIIVEGPFDALALAQHGVAVIALQTNRMSDEQVEYIRGKVSATTPVTIIPDGDQAGLDGALETGLALLALKIEARLAQLPQPADHSKIDPAVYFRDKSPEEVRNFCNGGTGLLKTLAAQCGPSDLTALQALEAVKGLAECLAKVLDRDSVTVALGSVIWEHFTELNKTQHRRIIDAQVAAIFERRAELARDAAAKKVEMTPEEREAALAYLHDPDLIARIGDDLAELGYVGEEANKVLLYLVATSRKMSEPLSANILSPSSAGKTGLIQVVARCMPSEEVFRTSRTTPNALYHMRADALKHRWFVIEERDGLEDAEYPIRTLQSERKLTLLIPVKDPDTEEIYTEEKVVEGPIAYTDSTTAMSIEEQNATRGFSLHVDITAEQTRRIQEAQAVAVTREGRRRAVRQEKVARLHQNAQRLLRADVRVDIPFAALIDFPRHLIRSRRDFPRFLALIQAVAFIHQAQRQTRKETIDGIEQEYIEATVADYAIALAIAQRAILSAIDDLNAHARDILQRTVEWLRKAAAANGHKPEEIVFTRHELVQSMGLDSRVVDKFAPNLHHRYFQIVEGGQGKTYRYRLASAEVAKDFTPMLNITTPEQLANKIGAGEQSGGAKISCPLSAEEVGK